MMEAANLSNDLFSLHFPSKCPNNCRAASLDFRAMRFGHHHSSELPQQFLHHGGPVGQPMETSPVRAPPGGPGPRSFRAQRLWMKPMTCLCVLEEHRADEIRDVEMCPKWVSKAQLMFQLRSVFKIFHSNYRMQQYHAV